VIRLRDIVKWRGREWRVVGIDAKAGKVDIRPVDGGHTETVPVGEVEPK